MNIRMNIIKKKSLRERLWKSINIIVGISTVLNVSFAGFWFAPKAALAANASADLDQCRNGAAASHQDCFNDGPGGVDDTWVNGNAGSSNSHYVEGESIPYRAVLENLPTGTPITLTLGYDIKHSSKFAIDYLTYYDRTDVDVDPVNDIAAVSGGPSTFAIPAPSSTGSPVAGQPATSFNNLPAGERVMTIWNGSISGIAYASQGSLTAAQAETTISITFTAVDPTVVLAWGGHIASRIDWGFDGTSPRSAGGISGSPYHMRLTGWTGHQSLGNLGNTDRSLSADAVIPPGNVIIEKQTDPDGSLQMFNFSGDIAGSLSDGQTLEASLPPGQYSATEALTAEWSLTGLVCDDNNSIGDVGTRTATINLESFEVVKCTFTNTLQQAHLVVIKHVDNGNGGNAVAGDFTMTINGVTATGGNSFLGSEAPGTDKVVTLGSYNVSESGPSGYNASYSADCTGTISAGQTKTCTVTNDDVAPTLKLVKAVTTNNGGNEDANDWTLTAAGTNGFSDLGGSDAFHTVDANIAYVLSESIVPGYDASSWSCDGGSLVNGSVTLNEGGSAVCTITNDDIAPKLTLVKTVTNNNGGNAVVSDFPLFINGSPVTSGVANTLSANTLYTATETNLFGYTPSVWGGDCAAGGTITLNEGDDKTCTITNDDVAPTLKLVKVVNNDNGGNEDANDWTLTAAGTGGFSDLGGSDAYHAVNANVAYALSESSVSGYVAGTWSCQGGSLVNDSITLNEGESAVCTITNDDVAPKLTLIKYITNNNGGDADVSDFPLFVSGTPVASGVANTLSANTLYTATETNLFGYTPSVWGGDCAAGGTITLNEGDDKTCTITNDDVAPQLTVIKHVINTNGGTLEADDFTMNVSGTNVSDPSFPGAEDPGTTVTLDQGDYSVTEDPIFGYEPVFSPDCNGNIAVGESKTCLVTNTAIAPHLVVIKHVINDNGGTAESGDFTMTINGVTVPSGASFPGAESPGTDKVVMPGEYSVYESGPSGYTDSYSADCSGLIDIGQTKICQVTNDDIAPSLTLVKYVDNSHDGDAVASEWTLTADGPTPFSGPGGATSDASFSAGTYVLSETGGQAGYTPGAWVCDGGIQYDDEIALANGETAVCSITNYDRPASITLIKDVTSNNGGQAGPNDFNLTIGGEAATSGVPYQVNANTAYALNETVFLGYEFVSLTGDEGCPSQLGGSVNLNEGESITCTITNDDIAPRLTVIKHVINNDGGNNVASDFTMNVDGTNVSDASFPGDESGTTVTLNQGSYSVGEDGLSGYSPTYSEDCEGSIAVGEEKTCTITNNDVAPTITLNKVVINDNGGTAGINDFGLTIGGASVTSGQTVAVNANAPMALNEAGLYGYSFVSLTGDEQCPSVLGGTVSLNEGENITCTITNNDIQPKLTVTKVVINDNGGAKQVSDFPLFVNQTSVTSGAQNGLNAGSYVVSETQQFGYTGVISGDCDTNGNVNLAVGDVKSCTITNNDVQPKLTVTKVVINDQGGTKVISDFPLFVNQSSVTSGVQNGFNAGSYVVSETNQSGYGAPVFSGDCNAQGQVSLAVGEAKSCTITNNDIAPNLSITKVNNVAVFANPGNTVTYTVVVTNAATANDTARNVILHDVLPAGFTYAVGGGTTKDFPLGDIAPGASVTTTYDVVISASQTASTYTNTATAQGSNTTLVTATSNVEVRVPQVLGVAVAPSMNLTKRVSPTLTAPDSIVTYTVTVTNTGDVDLTNVALTDTLPSGFTFVEGGGRTKTWTIGTLAVNHQRVFNYEVKVGANIKNGKYENKATVTSNELDPQTAKVKVEVRKPRVLGLATTGVGLNDYLVFASGLAMIALGLLWTGRLRRRYGRDQA